MLYIKIQSQFFLDLEKKMFKCCWGFFVGFFLFALLFLPYMRMVAILFNAVEQF